MTVLEPPAIEDLDLHRAERRTAARATLGVTGDGTSSEPLRPVLREHGLSTYTLVALGILGIVDLFQGQAMTVLTPEITRTLGLSIGAISFARACQYIAQVIAPLPMAALSQSRNRVMLCLVTGLLWSAITLTTGFVGSLFALIVVLVFDGLSTGSVLALHPPLLADSYPPRVRLRVLTAYYGFGALGTVISPLLVSLLAGPLHLTWRGVFLGLGLTSTVSTLFAIRLREPKVGQFDTEALRHTTATLEEQDTELGFFEIFRRLLLIPTVQRLCTGALVLGILVVPYNTYLSVYLDDRWDLGPGERGVFFAFAGAVSIAGLLLFGKRAESEFRADPSRVVRLVSVFLAVGTACIAIGAAMPIFVGMVVFFALAQTFITIILPALNGILLSICDARQRPHVAALVGLFIVAGAIIGLLFMGAIADRFGLDGALIALVFPGLLGAALVRRAAATVVSDMDRMIDAILEEQDIGEIHASGGRLPMLSSRGLNFSYGQLQVLFDVDFTVDDGEMVALLGTNGAGKSTLLKVISGIGLPSAGTVRMNGHDITYLDAERRLKLGITQIPGGRAVFGPLDVVDNLRSYGFTLGANKKNVNEAIERCLSAFPRLEERKTSLASTLSGGEQQMLGLCKALMLQPKLLLIDELSLGLAPVIVAQLLDMVREINTTGTAVVLVEQSVNIALSLVDHAYFMEKGQMRFDGPAQDLLGRDDLLRAVFLEGVSKAAPTKVKGKR